MYLTNNERGEVNQRLLEQGPERRQVHFILSGCATLGMACSARIFPEVDKLFHEKRYILEVILV
jgi:hypothetical protein